MLTKYVFFFIYLSLNFFILKIRLMLVNLKREIYKI